MLQLIIGSLDDDQAVDTVSIPLAGKSSIADYMVISSGRSTRQVASMANKLGDRIKAETGRPVRMEGLPTADWVLVDAGDIIIHLFRPEVRSFYNLERMWAFGEAPAAPEPLSVIEPLAEDAEDPRTPDDGPPDDLDDDED
ncbi:ribosome silencing factor [Sphingomonas solaris]|uniref:ribosome silencing factor n=1 Tax=Alterirhizorhabdus solaris TaxID=2529389 RepID=UPI003B83691F